MRLLLQRVSSASVRVQGETIARIGHGVLLFVGVEKGDGPRQIDAAVEKLSSLRIFEDNAGKMNFDAASVGASFLVVSQFTLAASLARGRRPSFDSAAPPEQAAPLIAALVVRLRARGLEVAEGRFGARMAVELINDGPVTFLLEFPVGE